MKRTWMKEISKKLFLFKLFKFNQIFFFLEISKKFYTFFEYFPIIYKALTWFMVRDKNGLHNHIMGAIFKKAAQSPRI